MKRGIKYFLLLLMLMFAGCSLCDFCGTPIVETTEGVTQTDVKQPTLQITQTPQEGDLPKLHVVGNKIIDENGYIVYLHGVSPPGPLHLIDDPDLGSWNEELFQVMSEWGVKVVRLPIHPERYEYHGKEFTLNILDQAVIWAKKHGMYLIIDFHGLGFPPDDFYIHEWYSIDITQLIGFWSAVSKRYANENTVAFYEIFNEPSIPSSLAPTNNLEYWKKWKGYSEIIIDIIRENDPDSLIIVGGLLSAYDLSYVLYYPIERLNIAYAAHPYPGVDYWMPWDDAFGLVSERYPVIFTELGYDNSQPENHVLRESSYHGEGRYRDAIIAYADEHNIGWLVWNFSHKWNPMMLTDRNYTPSEMGIYFKYQLQNLRNETTSEYPISDDPFIFEDAVGEWETVTEDNQIRYIDINITTQSAYVIRYQDNNSSLCKGYHAWEPSSYVFAEGPAQAFFTKIEIINLDLACGDDIPWVPGKLNLSLIYNPETDQLIDNYGNTWLRK